MGNKPKIEDSTRRAATGSVTPKRKLSRWESEKRRRRILAILISVVIVGVVVAGSIVAYVHLVKPWHQPIVKVNDKVYDMSYFVKMLRLYGAGQNPSQDAQLAYYVANLIRDNELIRQAAEEFGITINDDEIDEELKSQAGFDPESESEEEFYQRIEDIMKERGLSLADFKQLYIEPIIWQNKLRDAIGDANYPAEIEYQHVQVQAMLLGTEEEAEEVRSKWDDGIDQLIDDYSPSRYYPEDSVEWLPAGIESSTFDDYAFGDGVEGISDPIQDTTYWTKGGYWLVIVSESEEEEGGGEEEGLYIQAILLDSESEAKKVAGEYTDDNFAELAGKYSLHSSSEVGGDMGLMSLDDIESQFGEDNLEVIQNLELDMPSEPLYYEDVSKQSGYWVIEVKDSKDRTLIEDHRDIFVSDAYNNWLEEERNSEENNIVNYLNGDDGYEKILWALEHIS